MTTTEQSWTVQREGWAWIAISPQGSTSTHRTKTAARSYIAERTETTAIETSLGSDVKVTR